MATTSALQPVHMGWGVPAFGRYRGHDGVEAVLGALVDTALQRDRPGPYQLQAAIAAVHASSARAADTDWPQIVARYGELLVLAPIE